MRHAFFQLSPPRHPLARAGLALLGLAILGLLSALGLALAAVVVGGLALRATWRRLTQSQAPAAARPSTPQVLEGEYRVVRPGERQRYVSR
jgi:hypothetical protein